MVAQADPAADMLKTRTIRRIVWNSSVSSSRDKFKLFFGSTCAGELNFSPDLKLVRCTPEEEGRAAIGRDRGGWDGKLETRIILTFCGRCNFYLLPLLADGCCCFCSASLLLPRLTAGNALLPALLPVQASAHRARRSPKPPSHLFYSGKPKNFLGILFQPFCNWPPITQE